ncbi:MAG: hypothetical protein MI674_07345 [Cytophagales bacterium]|nr:hypothetical protein [Cytophagales bacterium]
MEEGEEKVAAKPASARALKLAAELVEAEEKVRWYFPCGVLGGCVGRVVGGYEMGGRVLHVGLPLAVV